jgi:hypothetical protein
MFDIIFPAVLRFSGTLQPSGSVRSPMLDKPPHKSPKPSALNVARDFWPPFFCAPTSRPALSPQIYRGVYAIDFLTSIHNVGQAHFLKMHNDGQL